MITVNCGSTPFELLLVDVARWERMIPANQPKSDVAAGVRCATVTLLLGVHFFGMADSITWMTYFNWTRS
jgi:hypothetical protein